MSFTIYENDIIMCTGENILIYDTSSDNVSSISLPKLTIENNQKHHNNLDVDAYHGITTIFTSLNGQYFCVCTNRKQLCLYERSTRKLISNRTLVRAASVARFTPNNDVVVADKSGDVYFFDNSINPCENGKLILGHLSMLLDCLVTKDNRYVVTTDRDEKIRVSCFPNAYNILSYCLGHKKFVTAVAQSPNDEGSLISAGGDGKLKFWDFRNGRQLASHDFGQKIPFEELETLNESLKCFELTEKVETLPVKHLRIEKLEDKTCVLVLTFYSSQRLLVYGVKEKFELEYRETLFMDEEPLECLLRNKELWSLNDKGLRLHNLDGKSFKMDITRNERLREINERWSSLRKNVSEQSLFPILYKRKFDNVQEYRERKKTRLGTE